MRDKKYIHPLLKIYPPIYWKAMGAILIIALLYALSEYLLCR